MGGREELSDLLGTVDERSIRLLGGTKEMAGRDFGFGIRHDQIPGQPSHRFQTPRPTVAIGVFGETGPGNGQFIGQPPPAGVPVRVSGKVQEQVTLAPQPEAQSPTLGQISAHAGSHRGFHDGVWGQGRAACRSCSKCTLAYWAVVSTEAWPKTSAI